MKENIIQEKIINAIKVVVDEKIKSKCNFNRYVEGKVVSVSTTAKTCVIKINGENSTLPYRDGLTLSVNDIVLIMVVNGDYSRKFVDLKRPY